MSRRKMQKDLFEAAETQRLEQAYIERRPGGQPRPPADGERALSVSTGGILPFKLEAGPDASHVTGRAGLTLAAEVMRAYRVDQLVESHLEVKKRKRGFSEYDVVETVVLLQLAGGEHMGDVDILREDVALARMLGREHPSADVIGDFLKACHDDNLIEVARRAAEDAGQKSYVPEENGALQGLGKVQEGFVRRGAERSLGTCATLDHDATVINSEKSAATWHYKGGKGYQPVAVVWEEQHLIVADELRDGNVPAGKDNLRLIQRAFQSLPSWVSERRFRADTACYDEKVLKWLADEMRQGGPRGKIWFAIGADMTVELQAKCKEVWESERSGDPDHPRWVLMDDTRADETVDWAEVEFTAGDWPKRAWPLRYLVVRIRKRQGRLFSDGSTVRYLGIVSNRDGAGEEVIRWYWKKAGSIEHVHDETKNGLGAGVLPCGQFGANAAWYRLSLLAYNVATVVRRHALPPEEQSARVKRLRFLLFNVVATLTTHARSLIARVSEIMLRRVRWFEARQLLLALDISLVPARSG
jgi:hypothetical protein